MPRPKLKPRTELHVYLPTALAERIRALAEEQRRPTNSQIILLLENGLAQIDDPSTSLGDPAPAA